MILSLMKSDIIWSSAKWSSGTCSSPSSETLAWIPMRYHRSSPVLLFPGDMAVECCGCCRLSKNHTKTRKETHSGGTHTHILGNSTVSVFQRTWKKQKGFCFMWELLQLSDRAHPANSGRAHQISFGSEGSQWKVLRWHWLRAGAPGPTSDRTPQNGGALTSHYSKRSVKPLSLIIFIHFLLLMSPDSLPCLNLSLNCFGCPLRPVDSCPLLGLGIGSWHQGSRGG